jgi:hypothetical protein
MSPNPNLLSGSQPRNGKRSEPGSKPPTGLVGEAASKAEAGPPPGCLPLEEAGLTDADAVVSSQVVRGGNALAAVLLVTTRADTPVLERDRPYELFRPFAVVEVHVSPADQEGAAHVTLVAGTRTEDR